MSRRQFLAWTTLVLSGGKAADNGAPATAARRDLPVLSMVTDVKGDLLVTVPEM